MSAADLFDGLVFDSADNPRKPSASLSLSHRVNGETQAVPLFLSPTPADVSLADFMHGMGMLKLDRVQPQQLEFATLLAATDADGWPLYPEVVACVPRRASKTTTLWAELLGRCARRPGYQVCTTAQTGLKARERFLSVQRVLARNNVGDYVIKKGAGAEAIEWANGSRLWVVPPEGGAFRGDGANVVLVDEAQEHGPEQTADILGGALALQDTMQGAQFLVAGTAGKARAGMLWDYLERGRRGSIGILEYAVPDGVPVALEDREHSTRADGLVLNVEAIQAAHPGIGTLTTLDTIQSRFDGMGLAQFQREYAGQWPFDLNTRAIDPADWQAGVVTKAPPYPLRYALGFDVAPDQSSAALVAAWRDGEGRAWGEVIEHKIGDDWVAKAIYARTRVRRDVPVGFDNIGPNQAVADRLTREARPRPRLVSLGTRDITAAAAQLSQDIKGGRARHPADPALDAAADIATRRSIADGSWAWGRRRAASQGGDIAPLVAWTNALRVYDTHLARRAQSEAQPDGAVASVVAYVPARV